MTTTRPQMKRGTDPAGNQLKSLLLQVTERDERGPRVLRVIYDDDTADVAEDPARRRFLLVWTPLDVEIGETRWEGMVEDFLEARELLKARERDRKEVETMLAAVRRDVAAREEEIRQKTEELRRLQHERDPKRIEDAIAAAVLEKTAALEAEIAAVRAVAKSQDEKLGNQRETIRKLKDAAERARRGGG